MTFPGHFVEHLIPDQLSRLSVSFLVDEMRRVEGGCAANIAYGLAVLGERPLLFATAGPDAAAYRERLEREGVDVSRPSDLPRRLHGLVLRLDGPRSEPARLLLHGRDVPREGPLDRGPRSGRTARSS